LGDSPASEFYGRFGTLCLFHLHGRCKQEEIKNIDLSSIFRLAQRKKLSNLTRHWDDKKKFTLKQAMKTQMGSVGNLYSFFNFGARWSGQHHAPAALSHEK
jgi:hypothetical protein